MIGAHVAYCPRRREFAEAFMRAVSELSRLHANRLEAIANGHVASSEADLELARENKERAKSALLLHILAHGC